MAVQNKFAILHSQNKFVRWCNGSTSDSGSACEGSNPSRTTKSKGLANANPFLQLLIKHLCYNIRPLMSNI